MLLRIVMVHCGAKGVGGGEKRGPNLFAPERIGTRGQINPLSTPWHSVGLERSDCGAGIKCYVNPCLSG